MFDAHAVTIGPHGMLLINAAMLCLIGWALWKAERRLESGSDWILLLMLGGVRGLGKGSDGPDSKCPTGHCNRSSSRNTLRST
ncbi:MAG: hypothetical protein CM1200mP21_05150 [Candidatus Poseidoniales archaeon]|nr:MAG: hypothetical protein CM1200mP21_05150 [Candidatus Poseidoniales archaeon]